jgi:hypothetical protein
MLPTRNRYTANAQYYRLVRNFAQTQPDWADSINYFTLPDEVYDLTLVSKRVYGNRDEFMAVMAAAGLDSVEQALSPQQLRLPTAQQLRYFKQQAGYGE